MHRILITDKLADEGLALLRDARETEVDVRLGLTGPALKDALSGADGIIVRSGTTLSADVLAGQARLKAVIRAGAGVDNIDVPAATREGIVVMNTPGGNTTSTAEHTVALLLALCRNVPQACDSLKHGRWDRARFTGTQLAGKTLGIVGLGRVGLAVAKRAQGLEMKVIGYDPFLSAERAAALGIESVKDLDDLIRRADVVSVHTPLSDDTRGLLDRRRLALAKPGVRIINCARGEVVDEAALADALKSGHVAGAALDVFTEEPPPPDHPLLQLPNVVATPHLGAATAEANTSVSIEAARLMLDFLSTGTVRFAVNMAPIDAAELADLRLYLDMAHRLGLLHAQMDRGPIRRARLKYRGEFARKDTRLIRASFAAGLLSAALVEDVNIVNAEMLAKERGIDFEEQTSTEVGDFSTMLRTDVLTDRKEYIASGTIFGNQFLRLVQLGPYHMDAYLDGTMLIFTHHDVPGLIGFIGTVFGKYKVNIAGMNVGRARAGGEAIGVCNLDNEPPKEALDEVQRHPQISSLCVVKLPPAGQLPPWLSAPKAR